VYLGAHPYRPSAECRRDVRQRYLVISGDVVGPRRSRRCSRQSDCGGDVVMMNELKRDTRVGEWHFQQRYRARDRPDRGREPIPRHRVGQRSRLRAGDDARPEHEDFQRSAIGDFGQRGSAGCLLREVVVLG
jgi:hypothetical protein